MKKSLFTLTTLIVFVFLLLPAWAGAATYTKYVATAGSDVATGDVGFPWATVAKVNDFIDATIAATDTLTVYFNKGDTWSSGEGIGYHSGAYADWPGTNTLTIDAYGDGDLPVFDAHGIGRHVVEIADADLDTLTIQNIRFEGQPADNRNAIGEIFYVDTVTIDNIEIDGHATGTGYLIGDDGIKVFYGNGTVEYKNCNIQNLGPDTIPMEQGTGVGGDCLALYIANKLSGSISVHDNIVHDINADSLQIRACVVSGSIYKNTFYNCGENAVDLKRTSNTEIYENEFYREVGFTGLGGSGPDHAFVVIHPSEEGGYMTGRPYSSDNNIVRDNYIHDDPGGYGVMIPGTVLGYGCTGNKIYRNWFENMARWVNYRTGSQGTQFYNNICIDAIEYGVYENNNDPNCVFDNNTFINNASMGVMVQLAYSNSTYENNLFYQTDSDDLILYELSGTPTFTHNLFFNATAGDQNIINWKGTVYTEAQQAAWRTAGHTGARFENPDFNNFGADEFWGTSGGGTVDNGTTLALTANGLDSTSTWTPSISVVTIARSENDGHDIGAYEYDSSLPPVGGPIGTYLAAWGGDYPSDTDKMWINSGASTKDGAITGMTVNSTYMVDGVNGGYSDGTSGNEIGYAISSSDIWSSAEGTIWVKVRPVTTSVYNPTRFFNIYVDINNKFDLGCNTAGQLSLRHIGQSGNGTQLTTTTITDDTPHIVGFAWRASDNHLAIKLDAEDWVEDTADTINVFAVEPTELKIGGQGATNDPFWIDSLSIHSTYQAAMPDWSASGPPTFTDIVIINDIDGTPTVTENPTATWSDGTPRDIGLKLSEQIINFGNPDQSRVKAMTGPLPTDYTWINYNRQIQISGDWYIAIKYTPQAGDRWATEFSFENTAAFDLHTAIMEDGDGNALVTTLPRADIGGTGAITLGLNDTFTVGSGKDFETLAGFVQVAGDRLKLCDDTLSAESYTVIANDVLMYGAGLRSMDALVINANNFRSRCIDFSSVTDNGSNNKVIEGCVYPTHMTILQHLEGTL